MLIKGTPLQQTSNTLVYYQHLELQKPYKFVQHYSITHGLSLKIHLENQYTVNYETLCCLQKHAMIPVVKTVQVDCREWYSMKRHHRYQFQSFNALQFTNTRPQHDLMKTEHQTFQKKYKMENMNHATQDNCHVN